MRYTVLLLVVSTSSARADAVRLDGVIGFSHIQQQAKTDVGTPRGERLVNQTAFTFGVEAAYDLHAHVAALAFAELDLGNRRAGELAGFDADGRAVIDPAVGGRYSEVWTGLGVRAQYRALFGELGYAVFARRWDSARADLPAADGGTDGAFAPLLAVRWLAALGGSFSITPQISATVRLEWRIRYYGERDGQSLMNDVVHGTQEFRPLVGVAWRP